MGAFPGFLAASDTDLSSGITDVLEIIAWCAAIPGLVCSMIAFVGYFPMGVTALRRDGRLANRPPDPERGPTACAAVEFWTRRELGRER